MYRLHGFGTQNSKKVLYVMEELGLDFEFKMVNLFERENRSDEFLKMNPFGKVPTLQHDDSCLSESGAICRYVANVNNSPLYPAEPFKRALVDQWLDNFSNHTGRWLSGLYWERVIKPSVKIGNANEEKCTEYKKFTEQQFQVLEKYLGENAFLIGDEMTIADLCAFAYLEQLAHIPDIELDDYKNLKAWHDKIEGLPSVTAARKRLEK